VAGFEVTGDNYMTTVQGWLRNIKQNGYIEDKEACYTQIQKWKEAGIDMKPISNYYYWRAVKVQIDSNDLNFAKLIKNDEMELIV
jgi:hypothetical protein